VALGEQAQPKVLGHVDVLVFIYQDVVESPVVVRQHLGVVPEQGQAVQQQVAEIGGVEHAQAILIGGVNLDRAPASDIAGLPGRDLVRFQPPVLPALDRAQHGARRPLAVVDILGLEHLLEQAQLVVAIQDREIGPQADPLGVGA